MENEILIDDDLGNVLDYEKEMKQKKKKKKKSFHKIKKMKIIIFNKKKKTKINSRRYIIKDKIGNQLL